MVAVLEELKGLNPQARVLEATIAAIVATIWEVLS